MNQEKEKSKKQDDNLDPEEEIEESQTPDDQADDAVVEDVMTALQEALDASQMEAASNRDNWMRTQAEFQNYKKRVEREQIKMREDAAARIIKRFLDVLDDLDRALNARPTEGEGAEWSNGIELIYRKLQTILEQEGVTPMECAGEPFDPNLHEAIGQVESDDHESGVIVEVVQQGYMIGERVLRPALVRIAS